MSKRLDLKVVETSQELATALQIRQKVFVEEQEIPAELDQDGFDETAVHVLGFVGEQAVATGRLVVKKEGRGQLSRIAIQRSHRGGGLGRKVVVFLEGMATDLGLQEVFLEPHQYLERFYKSLGYETTSGNSTAGAHGLIKMRKVLGTKLLT